MRISWVLHHLAWALLHTRTAALSVDIGLRPLSAGTAANLRGAVVAGVAREARALAATLGASRGAVHVADGLLGGDICRQLRAEAEACRAGGLLSVAASSGDVRSTSVAASEAPALELYARTIASELGKLRGLPENGTHKLAVVEQSGRGYARHIDNTRDGADRRVLTAIYYLNPDYERRDGGRLRAFGDDGDTASTHAPAGDRLVVFRSDALVHDVAPTTFPAGHAPDARHRWALTVWLPAADGFGAAPADAAVEARHFGAGARGRHAAAAAAGDADAQYELGEASFHGRGGSASWHALANAWYLKAARQGHAKACYNLGCASAAGDGVERDVEAGQRWFHAAAHAGHPQAAYGLGRAARDRGDAEAAAAWFEDAAVQGFAPAQCTHAAASDDRAEALKYFRLAARQGHAGAYGPLAALLDSEGGS